MPKTVSVSTSEIVEALQALHGDDVTTQQVRDWANSNGYVATTILNRIKDYKVGRGKFSFNAAQAVQQLEAAVAAPAAEPVGEVKTIISEFQSLVPISDDKFVPFGNFRDVKSVLQSGIFYPLFITGLSGNGKTHSVEQACAQLKRDMIRVNITIETDSDDLIGGFRLVDGETVWHNGPVVEAMERGAVLLLDEIDLASNKIMVLQSVLEGKGLYIKKINRWVTPAAGFNIVATANTKGRSDDTGKFIGTNVLNEAFLERFPVTFEQAYPTVSIESKILVRNFAALGISDNVDEMTAHLTNWADIIRKTYADGGIDEVITTRRLVNIVKAFAIWGSMQKAIELCTNRFDEDTKKVFGELYIKVSGDNDAPTETVTEPNVEGQTNDDINA